MEILNGNVGMVNIHDFKFILPVLAVVFVAAEQLDRNDYLLTVALMASASTPENAQEYVAGGSFARLPYTKLSIRSHILDQKWDAEDSDDSDYDSDYTHSFIENNEVHVIFYLDTMLAVLVTTIVNGMETTPLVINRRSLPIWNDVFLRCWG
ncbi:hypothetical protein K458DRAFT_383838 [Lentithecium fluviatile CBS 122367]|uniref:Uncharacterized protein n=1 Tax=Lentithecium fluviatile CBS 122367 TaxID=1168545 RepID=A0A6G1JG34_9PLEO|nr:hypothetical protein K458DRAFT_383838 [Lentithecium fluviatile CBS 122367]